ncbi:MAG: 8-amino-7-oxononanoate synthase [Balneolales bacterium]
MKSSSFPFIRKALEERKQTNQFRRLVGSGPDGVYVNRNGRKLINFSSNDYLGLASNQEVQQASISFTEEFGTGSTASRLITGTHEHHLQLEKKLADAMETEAALIFNSGYQANTTIIPALADRNTLILSDKLNHNSLLQGAYLSRGKLQRYRHNETSHLEGLLKKAVGKYDRVLIVTESVFSMDGDRADVGTLIALANAYNAFLMIDEAHAIGVLGEQGMGLSAGKKGVDLVMGTFGKSFGSFGAFAACSNELRDYLINFCAGFIYTTALPPGVIGAADKSLELICNMDDEREKLVRHSGYLRKSLHQMGFHTMASDTQIIPILIGNEDDTLSLSAHLEEQGIFAIAIRPPTVVKNSSRIRITISSKHTKNQIDQLLNAFKTWNDR